MKKINLTQGKVALVDEADFEEINQYKWFARKDRNTYYAVRKLPRITGTVQKEVMMHRVILGLTDSSIKGDHIDHNGLNNQRYNLRSATNKQNAANQLPRKQSSSKYKGVSWSEQDKKWKAHIGGGKNRRYIGLFKEEKKAAIGYDKEAKVMYGEFAYLNFPKALSNQPADETPNKNS